jgi:hypothetical protein
MTNFCSKPGRTLAILLALGLAPSLWAASQVTYKWLDSNGQVTYGDHPPMGVKAEEIRISTGTSSSRNTSAPDESMAGDTKETSSPDDKASPSPALRQGPTAEEARALCEQARTNLEVLQNNALIRQTDEKGEVTILNDAQKQEQINTAKSIVKDFCK